MPPIRGDDAAVSSGQSRRGMGRSGERRDHAEGSAVSVRIASRPGLAVRAALLGAVLVVASACGGASQAPDGSAAPSASTAVASSAGDPASDKLASVLARGTLVLSTDPAYPPQSALVENAVRATDTKCAPNQLTAPEVEGYDADTGKLVAERLGVEPCFVTPPWSEITAGNWGDRWDIAWGSGALTEERMTRLWVTQPYYSTPHDFFVPGRLDHHRCVAAFGTRSRGLCRLHAGALSQARAEAAGRDPRLRRRRPADRHLRRGAARTGRDRGRRSRGLPVRRTGRRRGDRRRCEAPEARRARLYHPEDGLPRPRVAAFADGLRRRRGPGPSRPPRRRHAQEALRHVLRPRLRDRGGRLRHGAARPVGPVSDPRGGRKESIG